MFYFLYGVQLLYVAYSIGQNVPCPTTVFVFYRTLRTEFQRRRRCRQQQPNTGNAT
jgi:hypothetical protein